MLYDRLKYADIFWFSLFHEIKHVLQQKVKLTFVSNASPSYSDEINSKLEEEANLFARNILIPPKEYSQFVKKGRFTEQSIREFAQYIDIDPCIVLGRLQKENLVPYDRMHAMKKKYHIIAN